MLLNACGLFLSGGSVDRIITSGPLSICVFAEAADQGASTIVQLQN